MHMITFLFSPYGIPANYRQMQGSGVNTYKWVNEAGESVLVKYHWEPKQGIRNLTQAEAEKVQGKNFNHATQDLYDNIKAGNFPEWELLVQIMSDDEHPELDFDPLDDTKLWPPDQFPGCRWAAWCSTATPKTSSWRWNRWPLVPACW
jgi:catalase